MPRNFGVRRHDDFDRFWNEPTYDGHEPSWPLVLFVVAVLAIVGIGIFIA